MDNEEPLKEPEPEQELIWFDRVRVRKTLRLWWGLAFLGLVVVVCALVLSTFIFIDNRHNESETRSNRLLIEELRGKLNSNDQADRDRLVCGRRYQDRVDAAISASVINFGDIVVILATVPNTNPDRQVLINQKVLDLEKSNKDSEEAVAAKTKYNQDGNPLPCPIPET